MRMQTIWGKYLCTGITLDGLTMNPTEMVGAERRWDRDHIFTEEADEAEWKWKGKTLR